MLVTKMSLLPISRSMAMVSGTPSMRESPFQMTPSQSKMNVSTESTRPFLSPSLSWFTSALTAMARTGRVALLRAARRDRPRRVALEETRATDAAAAELSAKDIKTLVCWSGETRRMCRAGDVCLPRAWSDESAKTTGGRGTDEGTRALSAATAEEGENQSQNLASKPATGNRRC